MARAILSCLLLLAISNFAKSQIKGGRDAEEKEVPYQVAVTCAAGTDLKGRPIELAVLEGCGVVCGGSLMNTRWVFIAAHCLDATTMVVTAYKVTAGTIHARERRRERFRRTSLSTTFHLHEKYRARNKLWS